MLLETPRFGKIQFATSDVVLFPDGLIGFESLLTWVLLIEGCLVWLQSMEDRSIALPLTSPFPFAPEYRFTLSTSERRALQLPSSERPLVLNVVQREPSQWTINLRAPVIVRRQLRLGLQIVTPEEQPLRMALPASFGNIRKIA